MKAPDYTTRLTAEQVRIERRGALMSMDRPRITAFWKYLGLAIPQTDRMFWYAVHRARMECRDLPAGSRMASDLWCQDYVGIWADVQEGKEGSEKELSEFIAAANQVGKIPEEKPRIIRPDLVSNEEEPAP